MNGAYWWSEDNFWHEMEKLNFQRLDKVLVIAVSY